MITISVNKPKCHGDGKCVEICPIQILKINDKERVPEFVSGGENVCINCGHCFSVCPTGAITLANIKAEDTLLMDYSQLPNPQQLELLMKGRRSIRSYKDKLIEKETIEKLFDLTRYAPSGINRQPVSWLVITGKEKVHNVGDMVAKWMQDLINSSNPMAKAFRFDRLVNAWQNNNDLICRNAPILVIAYGPKDDSMILQSCTIAATYLELAAFGLGLGACWAGYVNIALNMSEKIQEFIGLPINATAGASMMLGYSKNRYSRIPARNPAKILWK